MTGAERLLAKGEERGIVKGIEIGEGIGLKKGEQIGVQKGILTGKKILLEKLSQILQGRHTPINDVNELTALLAEELEPQSVTSSTTSKPFMKSRIWKRLRKNRDVTLYTSA